MIKNILNLLLILIFFSCSSDENFSVKKIEETKPNSPKLKYDFPLLVGKPLHITKKINSEIFQLIPESQEGLKIRDIHIITQNIIRIGQASHIPELTEFGLKLHQYSQSFDIEKLNGSLKQLYSILKKMG